MSKTIFIPIAYLYDEEANELSSRVGYTHTLANTDDGVYFNECQTLTFVGRDMKIYTMDIYKCMSDTDLGILKGFFFNGFHSTCEDVIKFLDMPADTAIY